MTELITREFRFNNARLFLDQVRNEENNLYLYIGNVSAWPNEISPPNITDSIESVYYDPWQSIIAMKRIIASDVSYASNRFNWVSGTIYNQYTSDTDFYSGNFYVITDDYKVFKCLSNNNNSESVNKPTSTSTSPVKLADGYTWKYMFSLSASDAVKFLTTEFFPVKLLETDDDSLQWDVQQAATPGAILSAKVVNGGSGYLNASGSASSGTTNTITLGASASATNSIYASYGVYIVSGAGIGQFREIIGYVGSTRVATVSSNWSIIPDGTSSYIVAPLVRGNTTGSGFSGYAVVSGGAVSNIIVLNAGSGYTDNNLTITGATGSGATAVGTISPVGGHGSNPVEELMAHNVVFNLRMIGDEASNIIVGNDFRVIGIMSSPKLEADDSFANGVVYDMTTKFNVSSASGVFAEDEIIEGQTSGAKAIVVKRNSSSLLSVNNITGVFQTSEVITGQSTGVNATWNSKIDPIIKKYSGRVMYIKNQPAVFRVADQTEDYRIVVKF